ncbi:MAG: hypothetical protein ABI625_08615 [bacterium]
MLTLDQIRNSPGIETHKPVSRRHERDHLSYYGYPDYWGQAGMWGWGFPGVAGRQHPIQCVSGHGTFGARRNSAALRAGPTTCGGLTAPFTSTSLALPSRASPGWNPDALVNRELEHHLYDYYGRAVEHPRRTA